MQPQFGEWKPGEGEPIRAGEIQRWRMIHGGVRDTVSLQIIKATDIDPANAAAAPLGAEQPNWVSQHCTAGEVVPQWEFAVDGLTRRKGQTKAVNILQPAYRSDALVAFPSEGVYCVMDQAAQPLQRRQSRPGSQGQTAACVGAGDRRNAGAGRPEDLYPQQPGCGQSIDACRHCPATAGRRSDGVFAQQRSLPATPGAQAGRQLQHTVPGRPRPRSLPDQRPDI